MEYKQKQGWFAVLKAGSNNRRFLRKPHYAVAALICDSFSDSYDRICPDTYARHYVLTLPQAVRCSQQKQFQKRCPPISEQLITLPIASSDIFFHSREQNGKLVSTDKGDYVMGPELVAVTTSYPRGDCKAFRRLRLFGSSFTHSILTIVVL
jgi:hypothetical protein